VGRLRLEFQPESGGAGDPAVMFLATRAQSIPFIIREGESQALFGAEREAVFQTGTTAGALRFLAEAGGYTETYTAAVGASAIRIETARTARVAGGVEVQLTGYDNTRTAGPMRFTFFGPEGAPLAGMPMSVDARVPFRRYFDSTPAGGLFSMKAVFPVTGSVTGIAGVEVEMENAVGVAKTIRLPF
jgi:hypothetical protein